MSPYEKGVRTGDLDFPPGSGLLISKIQCERTEAHADTDADIDADTDTFVKADADADIDIEKQPRPHFTLLRLRAGRWRTGRWD